MKLLFLILTCLPFTLADGWEDFTNNLATDLAPLITLFGEQLTKQFLSESINLLDNLIFALAPLGVLTAVVSVIRVCGSPSLKAFIGRAQEGPAEAESELLPCVSESTAELFNDGGISRVFGQPRILELVAWENKDPSTGRVSVEYGTLRSALKSGAWSIKGSNDAAKEIQDLLDGTELEIPNLSLNKGIKRRGQYWFYFVAILGIVMQLGVIAYASITVFVFPSNFQVNGNSVPSYAFPLYIIGTAFLFMGIFQGAIIIGRSSKNYMLVPEKPSKVYWLQPGDQKVGDQVFNAFLAVKKGDPAEMTYVKSRRARSHCRSVEVASSLAFTIIGFIFQFIGERGLHASVILAQLGSTIVMSILRTCLRTQRMKEDQNEIATERKLASCKQQELDSFAFYLEDIDYFHLKLKPTSPSTQTNQEDVSGDLNVQRVIQTRMQIAHLTTRSKDDSIIHWDDFPIRTAAKRLADSIGNTMNLIEVWGAKFEKSFQFHLNFECGLSSSKAQTTSQGVYTIQLSKQGDALRWNIKEAELEAILGLWVWSLYKEHPNWQREGQRKAPIMRMVGPDETDSASGETYLGFHKWVFRQTELEFTSSKGFDLSTRRFGHGLNSSQHNKILAMKTDNELELMAAQDIFSIFLESALGYLGALSDEVDVVPGLYNSWVITHSQIDALVHCFEDSQLGSREDALLCLTSHLRSKGMLPYLASDSKAIRRRTELLIHNGDWNTVFSLHRWLCQRTDGPEFERSVYELGYLCRRALLGTEKHVQEEGSKQLCDLLDGDVRLHFFQSQQQSKLYPWVLSTSRSDWWKEFSWQLSWVAWGISSKVPNMSWIQPKLGISSAPLYWDRFSCPIFDDSRTERGVRTLQDWLGHRKDDYYQMEYERKYESDDEAALEWALHESHGALIYWLSLLWIELSDERPSLRTTLWMLMARYRSTCILDILGSQGMNINTIGSDGRLAIIYPMVEEPPDTEGVRFLLSHGAYPDGSDELPHQRPLILASGDGMEEVTKLLIEYGASLEITDGNGLTPLYWACSNNQPQTVRLLLSNGVNVDSMRNGTTTPLKAALAEKNFDIVQLLLDYGCDVNFQGKNEQSPLSVAVIAQFNSIIPLLLNKGCDIDRRGFDGKTVLELAEDIGNTEAAEILRRGTPTDT